MRANTSKWAKTAGAETPRAGHASLRHFDASIGGAWRQPVGVRRARTREESRRAAAILVVVGLSLTSCRGGEPVEFSEAVVTTCRAVGVCEEEPPAPLLFDVVCDASAGSTCTATALRQTLEPVLEVAAARSGTQVRVWALGSEVADTTVAGEVKSSSARPSARRARESYTRRFVAASMAFLSKAAEPFLSQPNRKRSPIGEGLSKVALYAGDSRLRRVLILVGDAREVSALGDFECGALPSAEEWVKRMHAAHLLLPGSLAGASVYLTFVTLDAVDRRRCPVTIARAVQIQHLWRAAFTAAGAIDVRFMSGPVQLDALDLADRQERKEDSR